VSRRDPARLTYHEGLLRGLAGGPSSFRLLPPLGSERSSLGSLGLRSVFPGWDELVFAREGLNSSLHPMKLDELEAGAQEMDYRGV